MAEKAGVGRAFLEAMIDRGCSDNDFYKEQFRVLKENPKYSILRVALEGRLIAKTEIELMRKFAEKLGVSSETFGSAIKNGANPSD
jgi:hypothetical protein